MNNATNLSASAQNIIADYATRRGITKAKLNDYLNPKLDPTKLTLPDAAKVITRLNQAIANGEPLTIFGDYDADGITSTTILLRFFEECTLLRPSWRLPNRQTDHYGLGLDAAKKLVNELRPKLLITIDCGSNSAEAISWLKTQGVDTIIIDHHLVYEPATDAVALVNPKAHPSFACGDLENLCGAGLALHLCAFLADDWQCTNKWDNVTATMLAAVGTLADAVPMSPSNRAIAKNGLYLINTPQALAKCIGLRALVPNDGQRITQRRLQFEVIPSLNALGRLDSAEPGVVLLTSNNAGEAKRLAEKATELNTQRKTLQQETIAAAIAQGQTLLDKNPALPVLILAHTDWHHGIAGPSASQVAEKFQRSVILLAPDADGNWKGSGRGYNHDNLGEWLDTVKKLGLITRGGGHAGAVGVGVRSEQINQLRTVVPHIPMPQIENHEGDSEVVGDVDSLSPAEWVEIITVLEPFGGGNPFPTIAAKARLTEPPTPLLLKDSGKPWAVKAEFQTLRQKLSVTWRDVQAAAEQWKTGQNYALIMEVTAKPWNGKLYYNWAVLASC
jgi:single-stranded-DNA-specific exonuclease